MRGKEDMPITRECTSCGKLTRVPVTHLSDAGRCGACKQPLPAISEPIAATTETFLEIVKEARVPVLVDFWASWCGPCRMAAPEVARLAADMAGRVIVLKVNTEEYPELAARYRVQSIPTFAVFSHGQIVRQESGVVDHLVMESWLAGL